MLLRSGYPVHARSSRVGPAAPRRAAWITGVLAGALLAGVGCAVRPTGIVAMLTDYGTQDHYVGVLTANVLRANPNARIVTITHDIEPFNIAQGAFVLAEAGAEFPAGTVILGVVDPGVGTARAAIVVVTRRGRILVGPDNGLLDPLIRRDGGALGVYRIRSASLLRPGGASSTFDGRDVFAPVAGHLSRGTDPALVGPPLPSWVALNMPEPARTADTLSGTVVHVDRYGNVLTNLPADWLQGIPLGEKLDIVVGDRRGIGAHQTTYSDVPEGEFVVLRNASGYVEVARNQESAAARLHACEGNSIELRLSVPAQR